MVASRGSVVVVAPSGEGLRQALFAEVEPLVVRTVRLIVGPGSQIAEDAAQEALLAVWQASERVDQIPNSPRAWAVKIAVRRAIAVARRERLRASLGLRREPLDDSIAAAQPEDLIELRDAFSKLPPKQRAVAVLRLFVGFDERQTANALGCSVGTVKSQLHDARRALRGLLREDGTVTDRAAVEHLETKEQNQP